VSIQDGAAGGAMSWTMSLRAWHIGAVEFKPAGAAAAAAGPTFDRIYRGMRA
jgi:hypothetical protein